MKKPEFIKWMNENVDDDAEIQCIVCNWQDDYKDSQEVDFDEQVAADGNFNRKEDGKFHNHFTIGEDC